MLFLHGFLGEKSDFLPLFEALSPGLAPSCLALDLPAHGSTPYEGDVFCTLEKTIFSTTPPPFFLVGYSLGGRLALSFAEKYPKQILGLVLLSSHLGLLDPQEKKQRLAQDLLWQTQLNHLPCREFLTLWYNQAVFASLKKRPELLQELFEKRAYTNEKELAQVLQQTSLAHQPYHNPMQLSYPLRILVGKEDEKYQSLYGSLPLTIHIPEAGHIVHLENPMACAKAIENFYWNLLS